MSVTSTYTGWVPLSGGLDEAHRRLGVLVPHVLGESPSEVLTRWPNGAMHKPEDALGDPIPEVWLTYPSLGARVRIAMLTARSDLHQEDLEAEAIALCTLLAHDGQVSEWPAGTDFRTLPGQLRQQPVMLGCFSLPAKSVWAGPELVVRLARLDDADLAVCAPPQLIDRITLATSS